MEPLLNVNHLSVRFKTDEEIVQAVDDVSFHIDEGEIVGLVGESGSGKTVTGMSILRLVPCPPGDIHQGTIHYKGKDLLQAPVEELRTIRGREISVIFQEPMTALSPLHSVGKQLVEMAQLHRSLTNKEAWDEAKRWLDKVGIPDPEKRMQSYPYQFSGGMRQRAMIAMALMLEPSLIIADEPTTSVDVTLQAKIFDLLLAMKDEKTSLLFITHDMGVIWELSDRVLVMKDARIVEEGDVHTIFTNPREDYTRELLGAVPRLTDDALVESARTGVTTEPAQEPLIEVKDVRTWFPVKQGVFARTVGYVKAVDGVSFCVHEGETVALVGESGSGKTTLGRTILGLERHREGEVIIRGTAMKKKTKGELKALRRRLQVVFQDPFSSLNPRMTVLEILTEGLVQHGLLEAGRDEEAARLLTEVQLEPDHMYRYPHQFSGGQRQRLCVARALSIKPDFIVCDEAVSALDVTIQAQVIDLLMELQEKHGLSYLFITHDLSVVKKIAHWTVVMREGRIVEQGNTGEVIGNPEDEYTRNLIRAIPVAGDERKRSRS